MVEQERTWKEIALECLENAGRAVRPVSINTAAECKANFGRLEKEAKSKKEKEKKSK